MKSKTQSVSAVLAVAVALTGVVGLMAASAEAQVGPARRVTGAPVAAEAVRARFVWGASGNRIIFVNQADEVYYHRLQGNRVMPHIRMRGHTVGVRGDATEYVVPWGANQILVVTQQGHLYRHSIRGESIGPPEQITGAPVGTQGQDPRFMFRVNNRLINVTQQGEVWSHQIGRTVMPPVRLGRVAIATPTAVRHVWNIGRTVYVVSDQGQVYAHDVHPDLGRGRLVVSRATEMGRPEVRFLFPLGNTLYAVAQRGELFKRDITRLTRTRGTPAPTPTPAPAPAQ